MDENILVAYASKYGATKEIAETIGKVLRQAGFETDVLPVSGLHDLAHYRVVILGCAVYIGKWLKEAGEFLKRNETELAARPFWLFSSGPTGEGRPDDLLEGWQLPSDQRPVVERIRPRQIVVFHGNINSEKLNFIEKWAIKSLVRKPFGDFRDWDAIGSWAASIAETLRHGEGSPLRN